MLFNQLLHTNTMNIIIEHGELPQEIESPIVESDYANNRLVAVSHLDGLNVFIELNSGKTLIGLIHSTGSGGHGSFRIGQFPYTLLDSDVKHSRVV